MNEDVFLTTLRDDPADDVTWLALADWLDEDGQDRRAELVRLTRELRALPDTASRRKRSTLEKRLAALLRSGVRPAVPEVTDAAGVRLVPLPAGRFFLVTPTATRRAEAVIVARPFHVGAFAVTQRQYEAVMGTNPSCFRPGGTGAANVAGLDTGDFPVETVGWQEAIDFCGKLTEQSSRFVYRLPTVAEWEYAARAAGLISTPFHTGGRIDSTQANFDGSSTGRPNLDRTCAVGSYPPNAAGVYDAYGNTWEWCADSQDGGTYRAVRGGNWRNTSVQACRELSGGGNFPTTRDDCTGLRVVADRRE